MLNDYSSPVSNMTYKIGDTITIGKSSYSNTNYSNYSYSEVYYPTRNSFSGYNNVNFNVSNRKGTVQKIYSNQANQFSPFSNAVVIELKLNADTSVFFPVDKAINAKEIVVFPLDFNPSNYTQYKGETTTLLNIINQKISKEDAMLMYFKTHEKEKYDQMMSNEFVFEKNKINYVNYVDSLIKSIDLKDTFFIVLPVKLGKYNFDLKSFPIIPSFMNFGNSYKDVLSNQTIEFDNFNQFQSINSTMENAEFFANTTMVEYNDLRQAYVIVLIQYKNTTYTDVSSGMNLNAPSKSTVTELHFNICKLLCSDNKAIYYNFVGSK